MKLLKTHGIGEASAEEIREYGDVVSVVLGIEDAQLSERNGKLYIMVAAEWPPELDMTPTEIREQPERAAGMLLEGQIRVVVPVRRLTPAMQRAAAGHNGRSAFIVDRNERRPSNAPPDDYPGLVNVVDPATTEPGVGGVWVTPEVLDRKPREKKL